MAISQDSARSQIVIAARALIGTRRYEAGGGHEWHLGEPTPSAFDCSGFVYFLVLSVLGINLAGTSETQWAAHVGGYALGVSPLLPGMLVYFTDTSYPDPGHVGIVATYDEATRTGTYVSAYDTALGIIEHSFTRGAGTYWGCTDPISTLPRPTPQPSEAEVLLIVTNPNNNGQAILNLADGTYYGFPNPDMLGFYQDNGVPTAKRQPTKAEWSHFTQKGTV